LKLCGNVVEEKITTQAGMPGFILTSHVELAKARPTKAADNALAVARISSLRSGRARCRPLENTKRVRPPRVC
jgi:hypothetical protein